MPVVIDSETYYRTVEVCRIAGISRNTLFKWLKEEVFSDVEYRDWRGWRLFTAAQLETVRTKTNHIIAVNRRSQGSMHMEKKL
jgi:phage antirepressor YoqD-like protein